MSDVLELTPQIITTPAGDRLVVLPEAEYLRLLNSAEMAGDVAAFDDWKRRMAAGEEELVPSAVVDRLLGGDNPVRVWREHRGLSVSALAEAAGIAQPYLSQIETGKREGSVDKLRQFAADMRISIVDITC